MTQASELKSDVEGALAYGEQVRFKYYTQVNIGGYDDDVSYTQSGTNVWTSGLHFPMTNKFNGHDALLLQQGKIKIEDKKLYVLGNIQTSGLAPIKIGIGSPIIKGEYQVLDDGQQLQWDINGTPIYKKIFIRYLNTGSFIGE